MKKYSVDNTQFNDYGRGKLGNAEFDTLPEAAQHFIDTLWGDREPGFDICIAVWEWSDYVGRLVATDALFPDERL